MLIGKGLLLVQSDGVGHEKWRFRSCTQCSWLGCGWRVAGGRQDEGQRPAARQWAQHTALLPPFYAVLSSFFLESCKATTVGKKHADHHIGPESPISTVTQEPLDLGGITHWPS